MGDANSDPRTAGHSSHVPQSSSGGSASNGNRAFESTSGGDTRGQVIPAVRRGYSSVLKGSERLSPILKENVEKMTKENVVKIFNDSTIKEELYFRALINAVGAGRILSFKANIKALTFGLSTPECAADLVSSGLTIGSKHVNVYPAYGKTPQILDISLNDVEPIVKEDEVVAIFEKFGLVFDYYRAMIFKYGLELMGPTIKFKLILKEGIEIKDIPLQCDVFSDEEKSNMFIQINNIKGCFTCRQLGHNSFNCPTRPKKRSRPKGRKSVKSTTSDEINVRELASDLARNVPQNAFQKESEVTTLTDDNEQEVFSSQSMEDHEMENLDDKEVINIEEGDDGEVLGDDEDLDDDSDETIDENNYSEATDNTPKTKTQIGGKSGSSSRNTIKKLTSEELKNMSSTEVTEWWYSQPNYAGITDYEILPINTGDDKYQIWSYLGRSDFCKIMAKIKKHKNSDKVKIEQLMPYINNTNDVREIIKQLKCIRDYIAKNYTHSRIRYLVTRIEVLLKWIESNISPSK